MIITVFSTVHKDRKNLGKCRFNFGDEYCAVTCILSNCHNSVITLQNVNNHNNSRYCRGYSVVMSCFNFSFNNVVKIGSDNYDSI